MQRVLGLMGRSSLSGPDASAEQQNSEQSPSTPQRHSFWRSRDNRSPVDSPSRDSPIAKPDLLANGAFQPVQTPQAAKRHASSTSDDSKPTQGPVAPPTPSPLDSTPHSHHRSPPLDISPDRRSGNQTHTRSSLGDGDLQTSTDSRRFVSLSPDREQFFSLGSQDSQRRPSMGTRPSPPGGRPSWQSSNRRPSVGENPPPCQSLSRDSSPGDRPAVLGSGQARPSLCPADYVSNMSPERLSRERKHVIFATPPQSTRNDSPEQPGRPSLQGIGEHPRLIPSSDSRRSLLNRRVSLAAAPDFVSGSPERVFNTPGRKESRDSSGQRRSLSSSPVGARHVSISPEVRRVSISPDGRGTVSTERVSIGDRISRDRNRRASNADSAAGGSAERRASISEQPHTSRRSVNFARALQNTGGRVEQEVKDYLRDPNCVLDDPGPWREGKSPDYGPANKKFDAERSIFHPPGTVEDQVTNLVKSWEREASHKPHPADWRTVDASCYKFSCNGGRKYSAEEMAALGTYNALIGDHAYYSARDTSFEESHTVFKKAMPNGFAWEVVELYSGPPVVAFKWRHWGEMTGPLRCPMGYGSHITAPANHAKIEIWGIAVAHLNAESRITNLEIFYDPHELMASLTNSRNLTSAEPTHVPQGDNGRAYVQGFLPQSSGSQDLHRRSSASMDLHRKSSASMDARSLGRLSEDSLESHFSDDFYMDE